MNTWKQMYEVSNELERAIQSGKIGPHPALFATIESLADRAKLLDRRVTDDADALLKDASAYFGSLGAQLDSGQAQKKKIDLMQHLAAIRSCASQMKREQT